MIHNTEETQEFFLLPFATRDEDLLGKLDTMFYFPEPSAIVKFNEYRTFYAQVTLPEERPTPGTHRIMIAVDTRDPGSILPPSGISARINLAYPILIAVPQFGKFIEAQIQPAKATPKGEDLVFHIKGNSLSTQTIDQATGIVDIYYNGILIDSAMDKIERLSPGSSFDIYPRLSTQNISVGIYSAKAKVLYDGLVANAGEIDKFLIGDINVNILNISQNILKKDLINKIDVNVICGRAFHHVMRKAAALAQMLGHDLIAALGHPFNILKIAEGMNAYGKPSHAGKKIAQRGEFFEEALNLLFNLEDVQNRRRAEFNLAARLEGNQVITALERDHVIIFNNRAVLETRSQGL